MKIYNSLSIDVEEWYEPLKHRNISGWKHDSDHLNKNIDVILSFLSGINIKATFFISGVTINNISSSINRIAEEGHEIASHGYNHKPINYFSKKEFKEEIYKAKNQLEDVTSKKVIGFRAPFFSLNKDTVWALDVLAELGFIYDSSINPTFSFFHGFGEKTQIKPHKLDNGLYEYPLCIYSFLGLQIPASGGIYLRSLPTSYFIKAIEKYNKNGLPAIFYFHTREVDKNLPRVNVNLLTWLITYYNNSNMLNKLKKVVSKFDFHPIKDHISKINKH